MTTIKTMVGLSGGVDSSVAAFLLKQKGIPIAGLFMKNWEEDDIENCSAETDLADAKSIANNLSITLHARNFSGEYWQNVFEIFLQEYKNGRTPNPDVLCNREIKFKTFLEHAILLGADNIATGHYARISRQQDYFRLYKAKDSNKDQSYFLHLLNQYQLSRTTFPLGDLIKPEVRSIAKQQNFENYAKKDSTGICFIGRHEGLMYYTIGQRQGLGIGGMKNASSEPWYVIQKDLKQNILIAAQGKNHPMLFCKALTSTKNHWIAETPSQYPFYCNAKIRYRQADQACRILKTLDDSYKIEFNNPQRAVTPGQSVVFYQGEECLGGGIIEHTYD